MSATCAFNENSNSSFGAIQANLNLRLNNVRTNSRDLIMNRSCD